ncbi:Threonyl/alanyl tRNA synthetase SAD, partial [mine drainage metagenome]
RSTLVSNVDNLLEFDRTIFYPTGGGQPFDTGTIRVSGKSYNVIDVIKKGDALLHKIDSPLEASRGEVIQEIDWNRRYSHMRYHTAIHIIDAVVHHSAGKYGLITGSQIYQDRARVDFDFPEFSRELADKIIDDSNLVIAQKHPILIKEMTSEEALAIPDLARTEPGRELIRKLSMVRVIEIVGVDAQADGGTHVNNTAEVGKIHLSGIESKGRRNKRMNIVLGSR